VLCLSMAVAKLYAYIRHNLYIEPGDDACISVYIVYVFHYSRPRPTYARATSDRPTFRLSDTALEIAVMFK